jgi:hypothetical protein
MAAAQTVPCFFYFKRALKEKKRGEKNKTAGGELVGYFSASGSARAFANKFRPRIGLLLAAGSIGSRNGGTRTNKKKTGQREDGRTKSARDERKDEFVSMSQRKSTAANAPPTIRGYSMCQQTLLAASSSSYPPIIRQSGQDEQWPTALFPHSAPLIWLPELWRIECGRRGRFWPWPVAVSFRSGVIGHHLGFKSIVKANLFPSTSLLSFLLRLGRAGRKSSCGTNRISR